MIRIQAPRIAINDLRDFAIANAVRTPIHLEEQRCHF